MKEKLYRLVTRFSTTHIILMGFAVFILAGGFVLMMPISSASQTFTNPVDALFTSTTSVCVTGLVTVSTHSYWSFFGKVVILFLIQFGGLGFMTCFTMLLLLLRKRVTLKERLIIQDSLNEEGLSGLVKLVKRIAKGTLIAEGIGAFFYSFQFIPDYGVLGGIWRSIFTSISAFCNAGIDLFGDNSLQAYVKNPIVSIVTMLLIVTGGIGFTVWWDISRVIREGIKNHLGIKRNTQYLTLHSKVVLTVTLILIFGGALLIFLLEYNNKKTIADLNIFQKIMASFFQSITTRTAGFLTISQADMRTSTQVISIVLMFIGGSPAGTAGGIKTATIGVVLLFIRSIVKGKERTEAFHRTIPIQNCERAMAILAISLFILISGTTMLTVLEPQMSFMDLFYEATSALATVGLSFGITDALSIPSKILLIILMYIGRIGPITMAIAFGIRRGKAQNGVKLPEERVMVG